MGEVHAESGALLAQGPLRGAPAFDTDATREKDPGVAVLDAHLHDVAAHGRTRRDDGFFRLAVDRVFTLPATCSRSRRACAASTRSIVRRRRGGGRVRVAR